MSAAHIFVLVLVVGIVLLIGWLSWDSRRRTQVETKRLAAEGPPVPVDASIAPVRTPQRRKRQTR